MAEPVPKIGCVSNVFVRQMTFAKAGDTELGHKHQYDHLSLLASGAIQVRIGDQVSEFFAPHMVFIRAEQQHELMALADNTVMYCIHALRGENGSGDILDPDMVPKGPALMAAVRSVLK